MLTYLKPEEQVVDSIQTWAIASMASLRASLGSVCSVSLVLSAMGTRYMVVMGAATSQVGSSVLDLACQESCKITTMWHVIRRLRRTSQTIIQNTQRIPNKSLSFPSPCSLLSMSSSSRYTDLPEEHSTAYGMG